MATIKTDVPIETSIESLKRKELNETAIKEIFEELEFRTLINRVLKIEAPKPVVKQFIQGDLFSGFSDVLEEEKTAPAELPGSFSDIHSTRHAYKLVETELELTELNKKLCAQQSVCFDTETTGVDPLQSDLVGLSFAYTEGEAFYVPVSENREEAQRQVDVFRPFFENDRIEKIGQNLKYDIPNSGTGWITWQKPT